MKTVSTLCATGTVGVAATGLAFGVSTPNSTANHLPQGISHNVFEYGRMPGIAEQRDQIRSPSAKKHSFATSGLPQSDNSREAPVVGSEAGKPTAKDWTTHTTDLFPSSPFGAHHTREPDSPTTPQPSRSGLKRLSSLNFSRSSSPLSSFRPESRTFTLSSSSSTPMLSSSPVPAPSPPNKLVKRSFSQRKARPVDNLAQAVRQPTLKRPATSHQRSATLSAQHERIETTSRESSQRIPDPRVTDPGNNKFRHLFTRRFLTEAASTKSKGGKFQFSNAGLRRIYPKEDLCPILVLGSFVEPIDMEFEDAVDSDKDLLVTGSRPTTPANLDRFFGSPQSANRKDDSSTPVSEHDARRSHSIGGLLARSSPSGSPTSLRMVKDRLKRRVSRRVASGPAASTNLGEPSTSTALGQEPPAKRRQTDLTRSSPSPQPRSTSDTSKAIPVVVAGDARLRWSSTQRPDTPQPSLGSALSTQEQSSAQARLSPSSNISTSSAGPVNSNSRFSRASMTPSEITSSQLGSEGDARIFGSGDEDDGDVRSDTIYDSVRTGVTRSSSGYQAFTLETLFDKESPSDSRSCNNSGTMPEHLPTEGSEGQASPANIVEGEGSVPSPVRTVIADEKDANSSKGVGFAVQSIPSASESAAPKPLNLGTLEWDSNEEGTHSWSEDEAEMESFTRKLSSAQSATGDASSARQSQKGSDSRRDSSSEPAERGPAGQEVKINLFDWSEQQVLDLASVDSTPPRPKTVHGSKKDGDNRTGRVTARGTASAPHARSQSVPVTPEQIGKNVTVMQKFGTWGIGAKGITENWNDDFDFDHFESLHFKNVAKRGEPNWDDLVAFVPKTIRDQQTNVLHNINLLKEWGLLIEELKDLRNRAYSLGLESEANAGIFDEVDGMIDLADHEAQEDPISTAQHSITSSPGFDPGDFESNVPSAHSSTITVSSAVTVTDNPETLHDASAATPSRSQNADKRVAATPVTRPRQDSEAIARSVIEALHHRHGSDAVAASTETMGRGDKLPFDTATLKHIVPYVSGLVRKVKRILRDAEGLEDSPKMAAQTVDETFRLTFDKSSRAATEGDLDTLFDRSPGDNVDNGRTQRQELTGRLKSMALN